MPILTYNASESGLIIPVTLRNNAIDNSVRSTALIDTGVSHTAIHESIAEYLELKPVGVTEITTPNATGKYLKYDIGIVLGNEWVIKRTVTALPLQNQSDFTCLIGPYASALSRQS
jgi:predicted aspartyl protease